MFSKKPRGPRMGSMPQGGMFQQFNQAPMDQNYFEQGQFPPQMPNQSTLYPQMQFERLQFEIRENRRRINNLSQRIVRLENYLRIRDNSDYSMNEEGQIPSDFSM